MQEGIVVHALAILTEAKTLTAGTSNDAVVPGLDEVFSALQMLLLKIQVSDIELSLRFTTLLSVTRPSEWRLMALSL